jgi:hypothetical protein
MGRALHVNPVEIGGIITAIVGVAGALGAAFAVLRSKIAQTTLNLQRAEIDALKTRLDTLGMDKISLEQRIAALESANRVLGEIVAAMHPREKA